MKAMTLLKTCTLITFLFVFKTGYSQSEWIAVSTATDGKKYYLRKDEKLNTSSQVKEAWIKTTNINEAITNDKGVKKMYLNAKRLMLIRFNCADNKMMILQTATYDADGNILVSHNYEEFAEWRNIVPESVGENWFNAVCNYTNTLLFNQ